MTKYINITEVQQKLLELSNDLNDEPLIITKEGKPIMTAISYEQFESLIETLSILSDEAFSQKLQESMTQVKEGKTISWESVKEKLGL
ncbi:type II toxin-antitoxin system Phd/YefM family antitoxin [Crocosphaera chwakensis]|uniref:Antitoxin n=1 Tax=Crocosphaera chwakensis CCY0110 TaxID=391612 RepID=A3ILX9_9CHRO|nr:type II toxin-antitoxin system Phd/YefM family antitoxin [Crocosphaera chwakensis]EAZ92435.1 prevent-host-death family protein [Crocosphaera chwakensis CCY0110]